MTLLEKAAAITPEQRTTTTEERELLLAYHEATTTEEREVLLAYLDGTITAKQAASVLEMHMSNLYSLAGSLLIQMYRAGELVRKEAKS